MGKEPNDETSEELNQLLKSSMQKATRANLEKLMPAGAVKRIIIKIMRINRKKKIKKTSSWKS